MVQVTHIHQHIFLEISDPLNQLAAENHKVFNEYLWMDVYVKGEYPDVAVKGTQKE